jgi:peptidoglycan/LPS O-acetylase OafA/YrhL
VNPFDALKQLGHGSGRAIPSLDGARCISIFFVLASHLGGTGAYPTYAPLAHLGHFGVRIFFVISGYLITSILLGEIAKTGTISLARFYFRRTMRLFPAAYAFILVVAILAHRGIVTLGHNDLAFAATYTMNCHAKPAWYLGHLWSLAIEEQFYLVWPFTLRRLGVRKAGRLLGGLLVCAPFIRLASPYVGTAAGLLVYSDCLATGCLLAIFRKELSASSAYQRVLNSRWLWLAPVGTIAANYIPSTKVTWLIGETMMNIGIAVCLDWVMRNPERRIGRILNQPAVTFVGVLSYSLYLWQQVFLSAGSSAALCRFPVNVAMAFALAMASYILLETPFLRLRSRWERSLFPKKAAAAQAG